MKIKNLIQQSKRAMKSFSLFTLLFSLALASCSKSDDVPTVPQTDATTFTLAVDGAETRATSTITPARYVMEVWSEDGATAENVFDNAGTPTNRKEVTSGSITITLDKTKAYTCLFWADDNDTFNAASLKAISLNADKEMTEAYFANVAVAKGKNPAVAVTLKRAVAKITLTETAEVKVADDLALKLTNICPTFSVLDGEATGTAADWAKTIKPSATKGVIGTLYLFAKADKELSDLTFSYNNTAETTVSNIPLQQNHATNIKGEYSNVSSFTFTISADDEWSTSESEVEFPQAMVGDFYYFDKTFSNTLDANKTCIGIVYWVNPTDAKKGKIVSLDEATGKNWANAQLWTSSTTLPSDMTWRVPAKEELKALYGKYNVDTNVDNSVKAAVAASLSRVSGAAVLVNATYWSSEQVGSSAWVVNFFDGNSTSGRQSANRSVRVVSTF